jgi:hypothetical protein
MYQRTNHEALQLEHQLAVRLADQFGHHLPMSRARKVLIELRREPLEAQVRPAQDAPYFLAARDLLPG